LQQHTLLDVSRPYEWDLWASAYRLNLDRARTVQLTDYNVVIQGAVEGLGVAMGRGFLIGDRLKSGALVRLFDGWISPSALGYWVCLPLRAEKRAARTFAAWLVSEAALASG
jgi:LysR family glycine cleavage system transcriptional activator